MGEKIKRHRLAQHYINKYSMLNQTRQQLSFLNRVSEHGLDKAGNFGEPEFMYSK
jgi:hypothetical protein